MSRRAWLGALLLSLLSVSPAAAQDNPFLLPSATGTSPFGSGLGQRDPLAPLVGAPASLGVPPAATAAFPRIERTLPAMPSTPGGVNTATAVLPGPANTSLFMPGRYDYGSFRHIPKPTTTTVPLYQLNVSTTNVSAPTNLQTPVSPLGDIRSILETPTYSPPPFGTR